MSNATKIHYSKVELTDSEGAPVTGDARDLAIDHYRRHGAMSGIFFVNPETGAVGDWDYAPAIDWDGYDGQTDVYHGTKAAREQATIDRMNSEASTAAPKRRKDPADIRNINLMVKVTATEKSAIEKLARERGYSTVADYCRRTLLGFS